MSYFKRRFLFFLLLINLFLVNILWANDVEYSFHVSNKNPYEKDTSKIPSLRQQEWDNTNPDLDKRFEPERSCHNCIYGEEEGWTEALKCTKHNYMVLDGGMTDGAWYYAICDDWQESLYKGKSEQNEESEERSERNKSAI